MKDEIEIQDNNVDQSISKVVRCKLEVEEWVSHEKPPDKFMGCFLIFAFGVALASAVYIIPVITNFETYLLRNGVSIPGSVWGIFAAFSSMCSFVIGGVIVLAIGAMISSKRKTMDVVLENEMLIFSRPGSSSKPPIRVNSIPSRIVKEVEFMVDPHLNESVQDNAHRIALLRTPTITYQLKVPIGKDEQLKSLSQLVEQLEKRILIREERRKLSAVQVSEKEERPIISPSKAQATAEFESSVSSQDKWKPKGLTPSQKQGIKGATLNARIGAIATFVVAIIQFMAGEWAIVAAIINVVAGISLLGLASSISNRSPGVYSRGMSMAKGSLFFIAAQFWVLSSVTGRIDGFSILVFIIWALTDLGLLAGLKSAESALK